LDRAAPVLDAATADVGLRAAFHQDRAGVLFALGRRTDGLAAMRTSVALWTKAPHADPKVVAIARTNLGIALLENGDPRTALRVLQEAVDDLTAAIGDANPYCANG